jgi:hypothetical protein
MPPDVKASNENRGQTPLPQSGRLERISHLAMVWSSNGTLYELRRCVAGPLDASDYTLSFSGSYNRSALRWGYLVILSSV